ncbi:hypothetical protein ASALC70_02740 [Alcanivorax sp. ALC70]|nr:hypothetical protein ASALC70_02740 [Alcanivorax sp. ALC70]
MMSTGLEVILNGVHQYEAGGRLAPLSWIRFSRRYV